MISPDRKTPHDARPGHRLSRAIVDIPLQIFAEKQRAPAPPSDLDVLQPALAAERHVLESAAGTLSYYVAGTPEPGIAPLLLIHSINAAGSAYEIKPIFDAMRQRGIVYAIDLPGFGFSERSERRYEPRLMVAAILAMVEEMRKRHGAVAIDALALSLSAEFLARAASEHPALFRTLTLVSPTGFDARGPRNGPPGSTRAMPKLHAAFTFGLWREKFFSLLTSRVSIRYFLEKTWGSKAIDEDLLDYDYRTTHQPGAEHAPFCFVSGFMFSNDITRVYESVAMPVLLIHGTRGDFTDYRQTAAFEGRPNWTIRGFETGALPHFEKPEAVNTAVADFLSRPA